MGALGVVAVVLLAIAVIMGAGLYANARRRRRPAPGQPRTVADLVRMRAAAAAERGASEATGPVTADVPAARPEAAAPRDPEPSPAPPARGREVLAVASAGAPRAGRAPQVRAGAAIMVAGDTPWSRAAHVADIPPLLRGDRDAERPGRTASWFGMPGGRRPGPDAGPVRQPSGPDGDRTSPVRTGEQAIPPAGTDDDVTEPRTDLRPTPPAASGEGTGPGADGRPDASTGPVDGGTGPVVHRPSSGVAGSDEVVTRPVGRGHRSAPAGSEGNAAEAGPDGTDGATTRPVGHGWAAAVLGSAAVGAVAGGHPRARDGGVGEPAAGPEVAAGPADRRTR